MRKMTTLEKDIIKLADYKPQFQEAEDDFWVLMKHLGNLKTKIMEELSK